jgi:hypothetical protein
VVSDDATEPHLRRTLLGYVQQLPYVLMAPLERRLVRATGQHVLSADPLDPIRVDSDLLERIGWVDTVPVSPFGPPERWTAHGLRPLLRRLDLTSSSHRYGSGEEDGACLGTLWHRAGPGFVALRRDAHGWLGSELHRPPRDRSLAQVPRWLVAPLRWGGPRWGTRAAAARTSRLLGRHRRAGARHEPAVVLGYLSREPSPGWSPLFSSVHPVIGDQFVTRSALEATDLGYRVTGVLGHICDHDAQVPPPPEPDIPWASRFGRSRRYVEGPVP